LTDIRSFREILWPSFREEYPRAPEVDYRQDVDMGRLRRELTGGGTGVEPDVLILSDPLPFARDGLLEGLDDLGPDPRPSAWQDEMGRFVAIYVQPIVATYNSLYRRPPRSWNDLATEDWRGRLVFEAPEQMLTTGPAFAELRGSMGENAWKDWLSSLASLGVNQVADNERAVLEVATGVRWGGLANWNVARRVRPGSPVRHVFLDPTPLIPAFAAVKSGGRSPELARRFVRWFASANGQAAVARTGRIPAIGIESPTSLSAGVIPPSIGRVAGMADWVKNRDIWVETFVSIFPSVDSLRAGKFRA
jgi:ABC-type Fe3+ transport system substrate-binding protein